MVNAKSVPLSTGLGEMMAPHMLVSALILTSEGKITVEPGALHGRSELEGTLRFVQKREELTNAQRYWFIWVAIELDDANRPLRYKGFAVSELWVDPVNRLGYKNVVESVNRMAEAMRGSTNLKTMTQTDKAAVAQRLITLSPESWERSLRSLKDVIASC